MDIERLEIGRFGCLRDVRVDGLGPGVHVFHGTNETGKTTLLEFVRGMLFGFGSLARRGVIDADVESVGRLVVRPVSDGRLWSVVRRRGAGVPLTGKNAHDDLVVEDDAGRQHVRSSLEEWTGGLDEASYVAVMAFGLDELHELSSLQAAGCGGRLYELAGGLDRGHVFRVMENLRAAIERADSADPTTSPIVALERRMAGIRDRFEAAGRPAVTRGRQVADARRLRGEVTELEPRLAAATLEEERLLAAMDLEPLVREREAAGKALRRFDPEDLVHPDFRRWRRLDKRRRRVQRVLEARHDTRQRLAVEGRQLPKASAVWQKRRLIRPLLDDEPRLERLTTEAVRAETAALLAARRFGEELGSLGLSRLVDDDTAASHRGSLLPPGFRSAFRAMRKIAAACSAASRAVRDATAEVEAIEQEIAAVDAGGSADRAAASLQLAERLEQAAALESLIRKRLNTGTQLDDVQRSIQRIEDDVRHRLEGQVLPSGILTTLGTAFSVGIGLLFSGLLLPAEVTGSMAYAMAAVGLAGAGVAGATTWSLDRSAAGRVAAARSQLATAHRQRQSVLETLTDLDARLKTDSIESLDARLLAARSEVSLLEAEAARLGSQSDPRERLAAAQARLSQAQHANSRTRTRWRQALESRGFPGQLTPRTFRELARHRRHLEMLDDERRHAVEDARGTREDLTTVSLPIEQAVAALDLGSEGLTPVELLGMLRERLSADQSIVRRQKRVRRVFVRARHGHRLAVRRVKALNARIAELLRRWDVESEEAFLERVDRRQAYDTAVQRVDASGTAVEEARRLLPQESLASIDAWIAEANEHPLEQRAQAASQQRDRLASSLRELRERLAGVAAVAEASHSDRSLEALQTEAAEIEEELAFHRRRRVALQTALELLTETRRRFLAEHQPPVLLEASTWLERLTGGRYRQITAVADDAVLMIEDVDGVEWLPERLSRGTREQVFLALRLALVADLERAGIRLPLIMDDALVNFDDERARFAAQTLVGFANERGRQMLVLSCHAHVVQLFTAAGAHIRGLDGRWLSAGQPAAAAVVAEPVPAPEPAEPVPAENEHKEQITDVPAAEELAEEPVVEAAMPVPPAALPAPPPSWSAPVFAESIEAAGPGDGIPELPDELVRRRKVAAVPRPRPQLPTVRRPVKPLVVARHTWSAEEFDGELDDRVAVRH
jgi:uncharacterized protein YhaN